MMEPLLRVEDLTVSFDGFKALDRVNLQIVPNSLRVIIGPNGAGKSTLMDAIIGRVKPDSGRVIFKGIDLAALPEYEIVRRGICRKFQTPGVLESLSVEDNLIVAAKRSRSWLNAFRTTPREVVTARVEEMLETMGLVAKRRMLAGQLAHGVKQWLEIASVVASEADLLLLDEPAAGMTQPERQQTAQLITRLVASHALIVIDHDMDFVEQLQAPVTVLHMGRILTEGPIHQVRRHPQVVAVYLGRFEEAEIARA